MLSYLAGLIDAEGNILISPNHQTTITISVSIWNTDTNLLEFAYSCLVQLGYTPLRPYPDKRAGGVSEVYHITRKKDYWRLLVERYEVQSLLRRLPVRHREKIETKEFALSIPKGGLYQNISHRLLALRNKFDQQVAQHTKQAELEFLAKHTKEV